MEGFLGIFAIGMIGWWLFTVGFLIWIFWAVENDSGIGSACCLILYLLFVQFLMRTDIFGNFIRDPRGSALCILGYLFIGFLWSFVKWWLFVNKIANKRREARKDFTEEYGIRDQEFSAIPVADKEKYGRDTTNFVKKPNREDEWLVRIRRENLQKPKVSDNKNKIAMWVMYWPVSLVWSLLNDFVKKIIKQLVLAFRKSYEAITNIAFKNLE
jgi:hypothetical protein